MFGKTLIAGRMSGMNEIAKPADWTAQEPAPAPESYHIEATKSLVDRTLRTLKHDDLFGVFDKQGDCQRRRGRAGRPLLSGHPLPLRPDASGSAGMAPLLLGSVVLDDNGAMVVDLANADFHDAEGKVWLQRDSIHAGRDQVPLRHRLLRADQGARLRPGRAQRSRSISPSPPISPICSRCAATGGRGAGR